MDKKDLSDLKCLLPSQLCLGFSFQYCCILLELDGNGSDALYRQLGL